MKKPSARCLGAFRRLSINRRGGLIESAPGLLCLRKSIAKKSGVCNPSPREMGLILSFSNYFQTLWTTAETYLSLKYSVIPLRGDLDTAQPKAAAVPWKVYQSRRATLSDLHNWFIEQQFPALGIVTGRISRLMVLDFDTPELFQYFKVRYPHLTQTRTIQTHRGWHLYFCPPDVPLSSRKGLGVDLLSEGCYVVAPPSTIGETAYRITRGGQPRSLTSSDLHAIHLFLDLLLPQPESSPQLPPHQATNREVPSLPPQSEISASDLNCHLSQGINSRAKSGTFSSSPHRP